MAFCIKCGTAIGDGSVFCNSCGADQRPMQQSAQQPMQPQSQQFNGQPQQQFYQQPQQQFNGQPQQQFYQQLQQQFNGQPQQQFYQQPQQQFYQQPQQQFNGQPGQQFYRQSVNAAGAAVKKGGSLIKWIIGLAAITAIVVVVVQFTNIENVFKSDETLIRERIQAYEDACNNGDYEGMLDCMDAATRSLTDMSVGLMDGIFSEVSGFDLGISDMFGFAGLMGDYCQIEITSIEIEGNYATVGVNMTMSAYGSSQSQEAELPMVKEKGDWYIGGMENMIGTSLSNYY